VGGTPLLGARIAEIHGVAVEAHAGRRVGGEPVNRPASRDGEPVAVVLHELRPGGRDRGEHCHEGEREQHDARGTLTRAARMNPPLTLSVSGNHVHIKITQHPG